MNKKNELNIMVLDSDPHIIGITEYWQTRVKLMLNWDWMAMQCFGKMGWENGEAEYYYTSNILYQHTKYNYGRKQIAKKPYVAT